MAVKVNLTVNDNGFKAKMQQAIGAFKSMTTAITGAKNAQQALNNLIKANPMGLITTVGAAACETIYKYVAGVYDAEKAQAAWAREIENTSQQLQQMKDDADFDLAIAKAAGKSSMELAKLRVEAAKARVAVADLNFDRVFSAYLNDEATKEQVDEMRNMQKAAEDALNAANRARTVLDIQKINGTGEFKPKKTRAAREDNSEERRIQRMMADLQNAERKAAKTLDEIRAKEHQTETMGTSGFNEQNISNWISMMKDQLSKAEFGSLIYNQITENMKDMSVITELTKEAVKRGLNPNDLGLADLFEQAFDNIDVDDSVLQGILDKINTWFKDNPIELNVKTGEKGKNGIGNVTDDVKALTKAARTTADVVGSIGQAFNAIENPAAKIAAIVAEAIANVALGYAKALTMVKEAGGPWGWIAFAATGAATMLTSIAQIHSATGYAEGGIVRGNTYSNDQIFAGLNAGEVVLNRAQSGVLASQLEGNNGGFADGQIVGVLQGEHIALVAKRWGKRTGRGENLSFKIS